MSFTNNDIHQSLINLENSFSKYNKLNCISIQYQNTELCRLDIELERKVLQQQKCKTPDRGGQGLAANNREEQEA